MAGNERARRSPWRTGVVLLGVFALAVTAVMIALDNLGQAPPLVQRCVATAGTDRYTLDPDQADNVALLAAIAAERSLPPRAVTIAIATGMQESRLRNIDYGDRDSLGLFQQRPSQGWGTPEQVLDPVYATGAFYDALVQVDGWQQMEVTVAAQAVQRSAFPDAYAQHEPMARAFAAALTGQTHASLGCTLAPVEVPGTGTGPATDPAAPVTAALQLRLERELPSVRLITEVDAAGADEGSGTSYLALDATGLVGAGSTEVLWPVAQWAVASSWGTEVSEVIVGDHRWDRSTLQWSTIEDAPPAQPGQILVR